MSHDDVPPRSPLPPPTQNSRIQRGFSGLTSTDAMWPKVCRRLHFDPDSAAGVTRLYDSMESSGLGVVTSLTEEPKKTFRNKDGAGDQSHAGRQKGNLVNVPDGSFLVLLGSDDCYLLNSSFGSHDETLHTRIEHSKWQVSLYEQPDVDGPFSDAIKH